MIIINPSITAITTEYDLFRCINGNGKWNSCGLDSGMYTVDRILPCHFYSYRSVFHLFSFFSLITDFYSIIIGDVPQPIIKLRGNRAYFCRWATEATVAHTEMTALGMTNTTDLFEVV